MFRATLARAVRASLPLQASVPAKQKARAAALAAASKSATLPPGQLNPLPPTPREPRLEWPQVLEQVVVRKVVQKGVLGIEMPNGATTRLCVLLMSSFLVVGILI